MNSTLALTLAMPVSDKDHAHGSSLAAVTLVEYGDYECPDCGHAYAIVKAVQTKMGKDLRFVFRNFPLMDMHPHSVHAAEAALCAGSQGKFWEMHDMLFTHQNLLDDDSLQRYAEELGLHAHQFSRDMSEHAHASEVAEHIQSGLESNVGGTPTFFINGVKFEQETSVESLLKALHAAAG